MIVGALQTGDDHPHHRHADLGVGQVERHHLPGADRAQPVQQPGHVVGEAGAVEGRGAGEIAPRTTSGHQAPGAA
jgi:hypothetical protein